MCLREGGPVPVIQFIGVKQPVLGRELPFVLPCEREQNGIAIAEAQFPVGRFFDERVRRVRVGFRMVLAQSVWRAGEYVSVLILKNLMHRGVGQPVFPVVIDPDVLEVTMRAGVIGHPHAAVTGALEGIDVVKAGMYG